MRIRLLPALFVLIALPAVAQTTRPARAAVEASAGHAAFVDDALVDHALFGAAARVHLSPRVGVGPEVVYMRRPGADRDLFLTGNLTFDALVARQPRSGAVALFVVAGGGVMRHRNRFGATTFATWEGAVTAGGGVRVWLSNRVYALADVRVGWEPHYRAAGGIGVAWL